jgi:ParB/RepB/Spo0J family partition protein
MQNVKLSQLKLGPNVRQHHKPESITEMANSIKAVGILQNLLVRPAKRGSYEVIFGGRRFKALQLLLKSGEVSKDYGVPVDIRPMDDAEATRLGLIENLFREDMEPLEEAEAFYGAVHINFVSRKEAIKTLLELTRVKPDQPLPEELQFHTRRGSAGLVIVPEPPNEVDDLEDEEVLEAA